MLNVVKQLNSMKPMFRSFLRSGWQIRFFLCLDCHVEQSETSKNIIIWDPSCDQENNISIDVMLNVVKQLNINLCLDPSCDQDDNISIDVLLNVVKQLNINLFWDPSCRQGDNVRKELKTTSFEILPIVRITSKVI